MAIRSETRAERYASKTPTAKHFPISVAATNFSNHQNVAFIARALACFGGESLEIIGKAPSQKEMKAYSAGNADLIKINTHRNPTEFIEYCIKNGYYIIASELTEDAISIHDFKLPEKRSFSIPDWKFMVVIGNEMDGCPQEILTKADAKVYIPMYGSGWSINASQAANVLLYEFTKRLNYEQT